MLTFRVKTIAFFDRQIIKYNWRQINYGPLIRSGNFVRTIAKNSIQRRGYNRTSAPGHQPYSHVAGSTPPFKQIYSIPDSFYSTVIVGMVGYTSKANPVPGIHEHGGTAMAMARSKRGQAMYRKMIAKIKKNKKQGKPRSKNPGKQTGTNVDMKKVKMSVHYPKRMFMTPALRKAQANGLSQFWYNSFRSNNIRVQRRRMSGF